MDIDKGGKETKKYIKTPRLRNKKALIDREKKKTRSLNKQI